MSAPDYQSGDFQAALLRLLPTGPIWSRSFGSLPSILTKIWGATFARNSSRAAQLLVEAFPSSTTELLTEWESTLGLPDPCAGLSPTIEQRRTQLVARLTDGGGSSPQYYIQFATALGFDISITEFAPGRFGRKFGRKFGGRDWAYAWQVNIPAFTIYHRRFGDPFGEPFANWGATVIQCELLSRKPAHTILTFNYGSGDGTGVLGGFILGVDAIG
ncbi:bacteriophage tail protein [Gluconobacter frateurii M-2]|nr:bacteriophage tail protein [Gluconobacter frateurii M-2]